MPNSPLSAKVVADEFARTQGGRSNAHWQIALGIGCAVLGVVTVAFVASLNRSEQIDAGDSLERGYVWSIAASKEVDASVSDEEAEPIAEIRSLENPSDSSTGTGYRIDTSFSKEEAERVARDSIAASMVAAMLSDRNRTVSTAVLSGHVFDMMIIHLQVPEVAEAVSGHLAEIQRIERNYSILKREIVDPFGRLLASGGRYQPEYEDYEKELDDKCRMLTHNAEQLLTDVLVVSALIESTSYFRAIRAEQAKARQAKKEQTKKEQTKSFPASNSRIHPW